MTEKRADNIYHPKYLVTPDMGSEKNHIEADAEMLELMEGSDGYEVLKGAVIPYWDFDPKFDTAKEMEVAWPAFMDRIHDTFDKLYPGKQVMVFDAKGFSTKHNKWIMSTHVRVRGAGYYLHGKDVPPVDGCDSAPYKSEGARQLFRLPYCTKLGQRPLKRVVQVRRGKYEVLESLDACKQIKNEDIAQYLVQNVAGEKLIKPEAKEGKIMAAAHDVKEPASTGELSVPGELRLDYEYVKQLVGCLSPKRAANGNRQEWIAVVWCLSNLANRSGLDFLPLAHEFSKIDKEAYDDEGCDLEYKRTNHKRDKTLGMTALLEWAKKDNPEKFDAIKNLETKEAKPTYFTQAGILALMASKPDERAVQSWMMGCCVTIVKGGKGVVMTRVSEGEWEMVPSKDIFTSRSLNFKLEKQVWQPKTETYKTVHVSFREIFEGLVQTTGFLKGNTFDRLDFIPTFEDGKVPAGVFNLFQGFPEVDAAQSVDRKILDHLKHVLCAGNEAFYEYVLNWLAHLIQHPTDKVGVCLVFMGTQGTGKNLFWEWFGKHVLGRYFTVLNRVEQLTGKFNKRMESKMLCVLDEVTNYGTRKDNDQLKSIITGKTLWLEPKGCEAYEIADYCRFVILTNSNKPVRIEASDRRFPIIECGKRPPAEYFQRLLPSLNAAQAWAMVDMLYNRDIKNWNRQEIPSTEVRTELKNDNLSLTAQFVLDHLTGESQEFKFDEGITSPDFYNRFQHWHQNTGQQIRLPTQRSFAIELGKVFNLRSKNVYENGTQTRYFQPNRAETETKMRELLNDPSYVFQK